MKPTDSELIASVADRGLTMADLFLVGDRIYQSEHAGDFRATSTYEPYDVESIEQQGALVSLLRRLDAVEYNSTEQIDDEIEQYKEWESLFDALMAVLEKHGKHDAFGDGDFFLVDDYYFSPQHKIECKSPSVFTPSLLVEVQNILKRYSRRWEVIFALPAIEGKDHAYSVYTNECIEHAG